MSTRQLFLCFLLLTASCSQAVRADMPDSEALDADTVDADADVETRIDADADGDLDSDADEIDDGDTDADQEADIEIEPTDDCSPQDAREDPDVDCDGCQPCDLTPYRWDGSYCVFSAICCECAGADCGRRFASLETCLEAYSFCPQVPPEPEYPEARFLTHSMLGFVGSGPALIIDGLGHGRSWENTFVTPDWDSTDHDSEQELGTQDANELFGRLEAIDHSALPHPGGIMEGWTILRLSMCDDCEEIELGFNDGSQLMPEYCPVGCMFAARMCAEDPELPSVIDLLCDCEP